MVTGCGGRGGGGEKDNEKVVAHTTLGVDEKEMALRRRDRIQERGTRAVDTSQLQLSRRDDAIRRLRESNFRRRLSPPLIFLVTILNTVIGTMCVARFLRSLSFCLFDDIEIHTSGDTTDEIRRLNYIWAMSRKKNRSVMQFICDMYDCQAQFNVIFLYLLGNCEIDIKKNDTKIKCITYLSF